MSQKPNKDNIEGQELDNAIKKEIYCVHGCDGGWSTYTYRSGIISRTYITI